MKDYMVKSQLQQGGQQARAMQMQRWWRHTHTHQESPVSQVLDSSRLEGQQCGGVLQPYWVPCLTSYPGAPGTISTDGQAGALWTGGRTGGGVN
jgi:hypothetical protein